MSTSPARITEYRMRTTDNRQPTTDNRFSQEPPGRIRYILMRWKKRRHEGETRSDLARSEEVTTDRLKKVLERKHDFGDQDPKEVEARLRNMVYGTNRK